MSKEHFQLWWIDNEPSITHMLLSLGAAYGHPMEIDDLKSETFLRCWISGPQFSEGGYSTWLWAVAKSVIRDAVREIQRANKLIKRLIDQAPYESPANTVINRLAVESRIEILGGLFGPWRDEPGLAKYRLLHELVRRINSDMPISTRVLAKALGLSPQHVRRLRKEIATEILEREDAEVQSLRRGDTVHEDGRGQVATTQSRRVESHEDMPVPRTLRDERPSGDSDS